RFAPKTRHLRVNALAPSLSVLVLRLLRGPFTWRRRANLWPNATSPAQVPKRLRDARLALRQGRATVSSRDFSSSLSSVWDKPTWAGPCARPLSTERATHDAGGSLFDLWRGNRRLRQRRMAREQRPLLRPMQCGAGDSSAAAAGAGRHAGRQQRRDASNDR